MRLTKRDTEHATAELLMMVRNTPGIRTSELRGTRAFHGAGGPGASSCYPNAPTPPW